MRTERRARIVSRNARERASASSGSRRSHSSGTGVYGIDAHTSLRVRTRGDAPRMQIDKSTIISELEKQGKNEHVQKALQELPDKIDHEQHAQLLEKYGIDPGKLVAKELGNLTGAEAARQPPAKSR